MRSIGRVGAAFAALSLSACATMESRQAPLKLAITVDDLPVHGEMPAGETPDSVVSALIAGFKAGRANDAMAMINGQWTEREPATAEVLRAWADAGLPLGNHGWSHRHLSEMTVAEFEQEVAGNDALLGALSKRMDWRWFRYPFLDEGEAPEKRQAAREVLAKRGYRVAAVTMDFSDWQWTGPYARCVAKGDERAIRDLEQSFLAAAEENVGFYRSLSRSLYGRDIPYVLLMHGGAFQSRMLPRLLQLYRRHGFDFVSVEEAQRDPAYADQVNPKLAAEPQGFEGKAAARGIALPARTNRAPMLEAACV